MQANEEKGGGGLHPVLSSWFHSRFGRGTDVQLQSFPPLQEGRHVLIAAPTGSGKTLAALLPCLDRIVKDKEAEGKAAPKVRLLYITPLKALNNDVHHHVMGYIPELAAEAGRLGLPWPGLSAAVRTGDTTQRARAAMLRQPPDVLVTTPESLYILLTSVKGKAMLKDVRHLIVDEIHDLAGGDRGLHLSVTLERLTALCGRTPQRIGVSATQNPIGRVAQYLGGWESAGEGTGKGGCRLRPVQIIESRMDKVFRLCVTMPEQAPVTQDRQEALWAPLTERILKLMEGARSVLVFTNNRRLCERLTLRLNDHVGYEMARSHHGSVSREQRLEVERALKAGELRCLVATSSLELGIDVGHIDLVLQIDSPKSAASGIQRIGRAGHGVGDESRGIIVARSRSLLAECAVLAAEVIRREIEEIRIPRRALGVLCQQVTAMVAGGVWTVDEVFAVLQGSDSYHDLPRERFESVLEVLSGYYPFVKPLLDWNRESGELTPRSVTAMAAIMGAGTIPQGSAYPVHHADSRIHIGELDEEYIHESRVGDVFQLGTSSWKIQRIAGDRVYVTEAGEAFSEIPFWRGEGQGRSLELSLSIGRFLEELEQRMDSGEAEPGTVEWLQAAYALDARSAGELIGLVKSQKAVSVLPTHRRIVAERFQDEMKQHHLIIHSPFGRRLNRTWQLALQQLFESRLPYRLHAHSRDNGIQFVWPDVGGAAMEAVLPLVQSVTSGNVLDMLRQAVPGSPLFGSVFRRLAETSLLLPRSFKRMPTWKKRMRSESLLREALPYAERFPFVSEAMRICLEEELDAEGLQRVLRDIEEGRTAWEVCENAFPSPFAAAFLADFAGAQIYESDTLSRDLQLQLLGLDRTLAGTLFGEGAVEALLAEEGPGGAASGEAFDAAEPGELLRYLKRRGDRSAGEIAADAGGSGEAGVASALASLEAQGRAAQVRLAGEQRWIAAEEAQTYARLADDPLALRFVLARCVDGSAEPFTVRGLAARYGIKPAAAAEAVSAWAEEGRIEPAPGAAADGEPAAWVSREAQSRRIRQAVHAMRSRAEPAAGERYLARLLELQHVRPDCRLSGEEGLREVIGRLQGCFLPLSEWEGTVFPLRMTDYRKEYLDGLCAAGEVIWIGRREPKQKEGRVAFFLAEAEELYGPLLAARPPAAEASALLEVLRRRGASFVTALARETDRLPSEVTDELIALAWEGLVSSDQFAPLRQHGSGGTRPAAAKAKPLRTAGRLPPPPGRWYALEAPGEPDLRASLAAWVRGLLAGWGLLTRDLVKAQLPWSWDAVYGTLRQLESWGMLTRGLWVQDIPAMQYAAADTVESLRRPASGPDAGHGVILLPAADPANPFGLTVRWPAVKGITFARKSGCDLLLYGGRWLVWSEGGGRRIHTLPREDGFVPGEEEFGAVVRGLAAAYLRRPGVRKLVIETWDGVPIGEHPAAVPLRALGAETDRAALVVWPSMVR